MVKPLDAFPCPECGDTLYAHLVGMNDDGDFTCPTCGAKCNAGQVKDPAGAKVARKRRRRKADRQGGA